MNFASALFCDDIRLEVGNKHTYVGCYEAQLVVPELPIVLPKFCISVELHLRDFPTEDTLIDTRIFLPGDAPGAASVASSGSLPKTSPPQADPDDPFGAQPILRVRQTFVLSPLEIKSEGAIRVRVILGEQELRAGSLQVRCEPPFVASETSSA